MFDCTGEIIHLQSARKSERPRTNPMYEVAIARTENTSTIGCKKWDFNRKKLQFLIVISKAQTAITGRRKAINAGWLVKLKFIVKNELPTPTTPFVDRNCCSGSTSIFEPTSGVAMVPRMTASQTRNKASGIAVPRTIAVLQINSKNNLDII